MKKLLLVFTMLFSVAVFSQKESNGKLYIEHPSIEIVNQFNEAYTSGDLDKLKELVTENFFSKGVPLCGVLGGGYNKDFNKLVELHSFLHQSCAKLL